MISKSFGKYSSNVTGKYEMKVMLKTAILGHCALTAVSANVKIQNILHARAVHVA